MQCLHQLKQSYSTKSISMVLRKDGTNWLLILEQNWNQTEYLIIIFSISFLSKVLLFSLHNYEMFLDITTTFQRFSLRFKSGLSAGYFIRYFTEMFSVVYGTIFVPYVQVLKSNTIIQYTFIKDSTFDKRILWNCIE